jgi:hypothetical protein
MTASISAEYYYSDYRLSIVSFTLDYKKEDILYFVPGQAWPNFILQRTTNVKRYVSWFAGHSATKSHVVTHQSPKLVPYFLMCVYNLQTWPQAA